MSRKKQSLVDAIAAIRDPDGTGTTKVFHGRSGEPLRAVKCQKDVIPFHAHLDECKQCREQPFNLCMNGAVLLEASALEDSPNPCQLDTGHKPPCKGAR